MRSLRIYLHAVLIIFAHAVMAEKGPVPSSEQRAAAIRLDQVGFRGASLQDAVKFLQRKADEALSPDKRITIYCEELGRGSLTLHLYNQSMLAVIQEIAQLSGLQLKTKGNSIFYALAGEPVFVPVKDRKREEDSVREVVLRFALSRVDESIAYFVKVEDEDPSDAFVARFSGHRPPVNKASTAKVDELGFPLDPSGKRGDRVTFGDLEWLSATKIRITAGFSKCGYDYEVVHTNKGWRITQEKLSWIE